VKEKRSTAEWEEEGRGCAYSDSGWEAWGEPHSEIDSRLDDESVKNCYRNDNNSNKTK
jgi:hypothetical protein